uniref:Uncharacterized protein n=1 Tax=mine drainage metagenome TaxID=410659 RepID=E6PPF3_9ZZZZ
MHGGRAAFSWGCHACVAGFRGRVPSIVGAMLTLPHSIEMQIHERYRNPKSRHGSHRHRAERTG